MYSNSTSPKNPEKVSYSFSKEKTKKEGRNKAKRISVFGFNGGSSNDGCDSSGDNIDDIKFFHEKEAVKNKKLKATIEDEEDELELKVDKLFKKNFFTELSKTKTTEKTKTDTKSVLNKRNWSKKKNPTSFNFGFLAKKIKNNNDKFIQKNEKLFKSGNKERNKSYNSLKTKMARIVKSDKGNKKINTSFSDKNMLPCRKSFSKLKSFDDFHYNRHYNKSLNKKLRKIDSLNEGARSVNTKLFKVSSNGRINTGLTSNLT